MTRELTKNEQNFLKALKAAYEVAASHGHESEVFQEMQAKHLDVGKPSPIQQTVLAKLETQLKAISQPATVEDIKQMFDGILEQDRQARVGGLEKKHQTEEIVWQKTFHEEQQTKAAAVTAYDEFTALAPLNIIGRIVKAVNNEKIFDARDAAHKANDIAYANEAKTNQELDKAKELYQGDVSEADANSWPDW